MVTKEYKKFGSNETLADVIKEAEGIGGEKDVCIKYRDGVETGIIKGTGK